jgi:hypothetical protein
MRLKQQNKLINKILKPLSDAPVQAYLDNRIQLFDIIEKILLETGEADIYISTFSSSEEFLRRIYRLKESGMIRHAVMLADLKASRKTQRLYTFISNVFDEVYLSENHSKVILIQNKKWCVSICTSQNQTRGNRIESGIITIDKAIFDTLIAQYTDIVQHKSVMLNGLFTRTNSED